MAHRGSGRKRLPAQRIALLEQLPGGRGKADSRGPPKPPPPPPPSLRTDRRRLHDAGIEIALDDYREDDGRDVEMAVDAGDWSDPDEILIELNDYDGSLDVPGVQGRVG
jgi:hypothetical protein